MHIYINHKKMNNASGEMLNLSRLLRKYRERTEDVQCQLRQMTELDECKIALRKQEEAISELTVKLVNLSLALRETSARYQSTEEKIQIDLEDFPRPKYAPSQIAIYGSDDMTHRRIQQILYK